MRSTLHPIKILFWRLLCVLILLSTATVTGCIPKRDSEVVAYVALDREFSQPILKSFERTETGSPVTAVFDVEASKTVGLVKRLQAEKQRPRCDVFWNNEILHTIRLAKEGLLESRTWDIPSDWPEQFKASDGTWVAVAARARVLIVNTNLLQDPAQRPTSVMDLADAKWQRKCGVALPLYGTTATHFTILNRQLGEEKASSWFNQVGQNAVVLSGNKQVALAVAAGELAWGLTDTDDAIIEIDRGSPVAIVFPDQQPDGTGTILLPTTVAVIRNAPHSSAAGSLADWLISENIESRLAIADSAQIPLRPGSKTASRLTIPENIRWANVDYYSAAEDWDSMQTKLQETFTSSNPQ